MNEENLKQELNNLKDIFNKNWKEDKHFERWSETENTHYLKEIFSKDKEIFKDFLSSVMKDNIYCKTSKNDLLVNADELIFNSYEVYQEYDRANAKTDLCVQGDNFICVIENKFGSDSHGRKNGKYQCAKYREYILNNCSKDKKIFIRLDNEHCTLCVRDDEFLEKTDEFGGFYNAWFNRNVLQTLKKYKNHNQLGKIITKYCEYLEETSLDPKSELSKLLDDKRILLVEQINKLLKDMGYKHKCKYERLYDEIGINNKIFLYKCEYVELSLMKPDEIKNALAERIRTFFNCK